MVNNTHIGILGAGISGLSVAYELQKRGVPATVYEKSQEVGGAIQTVHRNGWLIEEGPNTLMVKSEQLWNLLDSLGLEDQIIEANPEAKRRFIVKDSQPTALPSSVGSFLRTPLLSATAKLRLLKEPFVSPSANDDESIARFIRRRLGHQPLDYGINPFVSGVYAGDPERLSIRHTFSTLWEMEQEHGSLLKGLIKRKKQHSAKRSLLSFSQGNQQLPKAMAKGLPETIHTGYEVTSVEQKDSGWKLWGSKSDGSFQAEHTVLVSTLPAYTFDKIFDFPSDSSISAILYAPLSVVALGFKSNQIHHPLDGFGMLIPKVEPFRTLGVLFSSTLFGGRAPAGHQLLTCFVGGARHPEQAQESTQKLLDQLLPELDELLSIEGDPVFTHHRCWPQGIPQYNVGYDKYLSAIDKLEKDHQGLFIDGNFRGGVSVPDCISSGIKTAQKAEAYLKRQPPF
jgi:oxygen-dependent protoporphyrinogen oxidase